MSDLTPSSYPPPLPPPRVYTDRSGALTAVGVLEICLALLCLLFLAFMVFAVMAAGSLPQGQAASPGSMLAGGLVYLAGAVFFGVMGVGTLRGRRWARTIGLVTSWMWLLGGLFGAVMMVFLLPRMSAAVADAAGPNAGSGVGAVAIGCISIVLLLIYLVLPLILLLFYRGPNVKATFEAKDGSLPWTDRVPVPVLALCLLLALAAVGCLMGLAYRVFPLFGSFLTGAPAVLAFLVYAALCAVLSVGIYRRRLAAWWATLGVWILSCVNGGFVLAAGGAGIRRMYEGMGMSAAQLQQIDRMKMYDIYSSPGVIACIALLWLGALGYILWCRRFFTDAPGAPAAY
jgi:hypothetical protein